MSFFIRNKTAIAIILNDLGLTIPAGTGSPLGFDVDLITEQPNDIAVSADLIASIVAGDIVVLDPLDGTSELDAAKSQEIVEVHNDPHYRIRGGELDQLDDVDTTGAVPGNVLQLNGSGIYVTATPDDIVGDATDAINTAIVDLFVDGTDTTVVTSGSPLTSIQIDVNDVFLRNTGDTLDSGTLTIAEGATLLISGDGGSGGATFTIGQDATATIATPTGNFNAPNQIVNKEYVDSVAAGFDPKESVRACTTAPLVGTTASGSPAGFGTTITLGGTTLTLDGVVLVDGDRVLVKDGVAGSPLELQWNGIYTVSGIGASVVLTRSTDMDGTPNDEISSGNFTFVEEGTTCANTGWVVISPDPIDVDVDPIEWSQFSGAGSILGDVGLAQVGTVLALDLSVTEVTAATPVLADRIAFHDVDGTTQSPTGTKTYGSTFQEMFDALDVPYGLTGTGIVVQTGDDTYTKVSIVAAGFGDRDGIEVLNGDGTAGNPTIGLDIENLPYLSSGSPSGTIDSTDRVAVYDVSGDRNVYYTINDIAGALASVNSFETWAGGGNTSGDASIVADSATDTATLAGGVGINVGVTASSDTLTLDLSFAAIPAVGSPSTIDVTDEIIVNDGGTIVKTTLGDLISDLGLDVDEKVKVSANDTTAGFLNGKLIAGVYTTLTENVDGGDETLTVDVDPSTITIADLGDVNLQGSPAPLDGDILVFSDGSPGGWQNVPSSSISFDVCTLPDGSLATLDLTDTIAVCDSGTTVKFTFGDLFDVFDVVSGVTGAGIIVKTSGSPDSYETRTIEVAGVGLGDGLAITDGDGVAGNPTLELDIDGTPGAGEDMAATDEFIGNNTSASANEKFTGQEIADGVSTILGLGGISMEVIGGSGSPGEQQLFVEDPTRANKKLSAAEWTISFSENNVGNNDWIQVGNSNDALSGFIVPMNATIVRVTAMTSSKNVSAKPITLYVDGTATTSYFTFAAGTGETEVIDIIKNTDIIAGEKIRLRGGPASGTLQDTIITLWLRWRT